MHYWEVSGNTNNDGIVYQKGEIFMAKSNVIIIHGGGLVEPSKVVLMRIAEELHLRHVYNEIFIGKYSFEALYSPEFWLEYNETLIETVKGKRGPFFGTSRGIDLTDPELSEKAISCLTDRNVKTVIVAGGDGSSRQVAEINDTFMKSGINLIFAVPLTIDGINGGLSIGMNEAVKESIRQTENIVSTAFETRDYGNYGVVMIELQGRNRDDILANVLKQFYDEYKVADYNLSEIFLKVIPANYETNENKLVDEINKSSARTLLLVSEGAEIKIPELTKKLNRKVRSLIVGYPSQSNNMMSTFDNEIYDMWIGYACAIIESNPYNSFCIANLALDFEDGFCYLDGLGYKFSIEQKPINYYAELNPREGQKAELSGELEDLILQYMSKTE